jgi:hypothetical protein
MCKLLQLGCWKVGVIPDAQLLIATLLLVLTTGFPDFGDDEFAASLPRGVLAVWDIGAAARETTRYWRTRLYQWFLALAAGTRRGRERAPARLGVLQSAGRLAGRH